jgi:Leucine-rich repeat (LRR) protein
MAQVSGTALIYQVFLVGNELVLEEYYRELRLTCKRLKAVIDPHLERASLGFRNEGDIQAFVQQGWPKTVEWLRIGTCFTKEDIEALKETEMPALSIVEFCRPEIMEAILGEDEEREYRERGLYLSDGDIVAWPNIKELYLSQGILFNFPNWIRSTTSLVRLEISYCAQLDIPDWIDTLKCLQYLRFHKIKQLFDPPEALGRLANLTHLNFDECHSFITLPETLSQLECLEILELIACVDLISLPSALPKSLTSIEIEDCYELEHFPSNLLDLTALSEFTLMKDRLMMDFPEWIVQARSLKSLTIGFDHVTALPDSFGRHFGALKSLHISCDLQELPESFGVEMRSLKILVITSEELTYLPDSIGELRQLESLDASLCRALETLPANIEKLTKLTSLELYSCSSLVRLPDEIGCLKSLKSLELPACEALEALPDSIGKLSALDSLEISGCTSLTYFPGPEHTKGMLSLKTLYAHNVGNIGGLKIELPFLVTLIV